jgi:hypothetical protein
VDTKYSLDCTNEDDVILSLFPELFAFVSDLESVLDTSMDEVFRQDLDCSCLLVAAFPLEWHMILFDTVGCIVNPLPLEDLPIVGHSDKNAKVMVHGGEDIGVDGLNELDPGPSTHDGIHIYGIMDMFQVSFTMNLYLHHLLHLTMSFLLSSEDIRPFLLSKSRQPMATVMAIPTIFCQSLGGRSM